MPTLGSASTTYAHFIIAVNIYNVGLVKCAQRVACINYSRHRRCVQVCVELEEEKSKHAQDMEQGDNVTYMLEKDRERLKQEVGLCLC